MKKDQLLTLLGILGRVFIYVFLGIVIAAGSFSKVQWWAALDAAGMAVLAATVSYFNPNDKRIGRGAEE